MKILTRERKNAKGRREQASVISALDNEIPCFVLFASFVVNLSGQTILHAAERFKTTRVSARVHRLVRCGSNFTTKDAKSTKEKGRESENKMFAAILQFSVVEVDEQSNLHAGQFHVSQRLRFVNGNS